MSKWAGESIHDAILSTLTSAPIGKKITKLESTWLPGPILETIKFYDDSELLFTLTFSWNPDGTFQSVART